MRKKISKFLAALILIIVSIIFLFPLAITFTNSFMLSNEISINYTSKLSIFDMLDQIKEKFIVMSLVPRELTFSQYIDVLLNNPSFTVLLVNSIKITAPVVFGSLIVSLLSAYGFTIWKFRFKEAIFFIYIVVMLMPLQAVLVPNYIVADLLDIKDSYLAIILPGIFAPFGTFLLRQSLKVMPYEYFEAAEIDGAGEAYMFLHVVLPQMKSGIAALSILVFIEYWNLVEQAVIFIKDYYREPLSIFLSRISQDNVSIIFAASCVYMFLPFWFLVLCQKDLEKGIELSGIK